jgi:hypothetical protein
VARISCGTDALDDDAVARVAAAESERIKLIGIVGGPPGDDGDLVVLGEGFGSLRRHFRCGGRVRRIVFVEKQNVHALLFCRPGKPLAGLLAGDGGGFFLQNRIAHHKDVHLRAPETIESFLGTANDGLVVVERGI